MNVEEHLLDATFQCLSGGDSMAIQVLTRKWACQILCTGGLKEAACLERKVLANHPSSRSTPPCRKLSQSRPPRQYLAPIC